MKNLIKSIGTACCASLILFSGCIDETIPTNIATADQLASSAKATEALLWAMPAFANNFGTLDPDDPEHYDWGYGSIMHIRDVMTEDFTKVSSGYDWYTQWANNQYIGERYMRPQFIWNYLWKFVQTSNNMIATIDPENATGMQLGYLGVGYAFRAFQYLDLARTFEFLENDGIDKVNTAGKNVLKLTVPIVTETTTEDEARDNPRVTREEMYEFILSDLNKAEEYIAGFARPTKTLPNLSVVYGLKARLYMWVEDYANAKLYARKAIDTGGFTPTTKDQWQNKTSGFNDITTPSWMWGSQMQAEDDVVKSGIINWSSWVSNEAIFSYANAGPLILIDARVYSQISNDDFRKLSWKAPEGHPLSGKEPFIDDAVGATFPEYAALKFRPGSGEVQDYKVGAASAYPLMRVEEMYFIEAEAAIQLGQGVGLLEDFMQTYRYASYTCRLTDKEGAIKELFLQKRVEFWGEGLNFFDYKRLNMPVTRGYEGTNHPDARRFNTTTRPAWMMYSIVQSEKNNNTALVGYENPDSSDCYKPWTGN